MTSQEEMGFQVNEEKSYFMITGKVETWKNRNTITFREITI